MNDAKKNFITGLVAALGVAVIGGTIIVGYPRGAAEITADSKNGAVSVIDGRQYIDITAKGGYFPRRVTARSGMPTTLRVATSGTYDCSAALAIPALSYRKNLMPTAVEEVEIPVGKTTGALRGLCSMGMYRFDIVFEP